MQLTIDGEWEATAAYALNELFIELPSTMEPKIRVAEAVLIHPATTAFAKNSLPIATVPRMLTAIRAWLESKNFPALESFCRADRMTRSAKSSSNKRGSAKQSISKADLSPPSWYQQYLKTLHWQDLRVRAVKYYGGCCICGAIDQLNVHHRHYHSLGNEDIGHLSVFCRTHHEQVTIIHGLVVPADCPDAVARILKKTRGAMPLAPSVCHSARKAAGCDDEEGRDSAGYR